jgi:hypothetical protein
MLLESNPGHPRDYACMTSLLINDIADSVGTPIVGGDFRKQRAKGVGMLQADLESHGHLIEEAAMAVLTELNSSSAVRFK